MRWISKFQLNTKEKLCIINNYKGIVLPTNLAPLNAQHKMKHAAPANDPNIIL